MPFQTVVRRNFTTGFPGDIVRDGPTRAVTARISALTPTKDSDPRNQGNRVSRVFGYTGEIPVSGTTLAAMVPTVEIGGAAFAGLLMHPKHHVLSGSPTGGTLAPSLNLPYGVEAEFFNMLTGGVVEILNNTAATVTINPGDSLAYVANTIVSASEPLGLPYGAIVPFPAGSTLPAGFLPIPSAIVLNSITLAASAVGAIVAGLTIVQLTQ